MQPPELLEPTGPALCTCVCNQKGGVGKTISTCNQARAAALRGLRVLVVDFDPQGNATSALSADELPDTAPGIANVIIEGAEYTVRDVVVPTVWNGVDLAPTPNTKALARAEREIAAITGGREHRLREALEPVADEYDLVLIDTNPHLGLLLTNALVAAKLALIVAQPEQWSTDGLSELHDTIDVVRRYHNSALEWVGPLINGKERKSQHDRIIRESIIPFYGDRAWSDPMDIIPYRAGIPDHLLAGIGLDEVNDPKMRLVGEAYGRFVERLLTAGGRI